MSSDRYRSRKFLIAAASLVVASMMALYAMGMVMLDGGGGTDAAAILGAWGVCDAAILKLYNDANLKDEDGPGR